MKQEFRKTSELSLWEDNPRNIRPKDFERLKKQIQELGQYKPLLITEDGTVIGGNMRLRAYMDLGIEDIWVSVVNPKDENQMLAYALSDNDRAGYYDDDLLANLSSAYPDFEWGNYAVDLAPPTTLDDLFKTEVEEDEAPEVDETSEPVSKLGEIYQLGKHRLMCGDSTKIEDVEKLMNGQKADMVFTDPPYGIEYDRHISNKQSFQEGIVNDDKSTGWLLNIPKGIPTYICTRWDVYPLIYSELTELGHIKNVIVWDKVSHGMGDTDTTYAPSHEFIVYLADASEQLKERDRDVISVSRENGLHPTMKPIELIAKLFRNHPYKKNILDLFGGSGSTLIACEQLNRTCYMMELDPKYCDVIRKRYAKFIGKEEAWEEVSPRVMQVDQQSTQTS